MSIVNIPVNVSSSGDTTLLAADASLSYRVIGYCLTAYGDVLIKLYESSGPTVLTYIRGKDGGGAVLPPSEDWHMDLPINKALKINLDAAVQVVGHVTVKKV